jgi:alpha/beta superfamily hydrolase
MFRSGILNAERRMSTDHKEVKLHGSTGQLEAVLWTPHQFEEVPLAAVLCHPHPLYQGTMHNKVVYQAAKALEAVGIPVLRFNFRGVGASEGTYDHGRGEEDDVRAALDFLSAEFAGVPLIAAGFSFGAWVGLRAGCLDSRVAELIGIGLPIDDPKLSFEYLRTCAKPKLLLQAENDQYAARPHFETFSAHFSPDAAAATHLVFIPGDHFFAGHLDKMRDALRSWLVERHERLRASPASK